MICTYPTCKKWQIAGCEFCKDKPEPLPDHECASCIESVMAIDGLYCIRTMPINVKADGSCREWERKGNV